MHEHMRNGSQSSLLKEMKYNLYYINLRTMDFPTRQELCFAISITNQEVQTICASVYTNIQIMQVLVR